ncbi:PTS transporter subunit EIIC [Carnobacterium mobile]|uniref:PTS transporter subunit EIIC n=1 Tax=Carnobacterium mobile TaxID=2750 RepID=UPI001866E5FC|nr:PTS transporter subunit EIIC [Carnobacterium mobile]
MGKNKFITSFERFGRSFLLPVSVLPAAGIISGIGSAFTNENTVSMYPFLDNVILQNVMKAFTALGSVAFDNLPIIFAVGVAVGLAQREKGSAALSGLLGFLVLHKMLNFLLVATNQLVSTEGMSSVEAKLALADKMQTTVLGIQTMDLNVFGGIITGIIVYLIHKKAIKVQLPAVVGFFSGPRFVPIVTIPVMALTAIGFILIWPMVQSGINVLSIWILKSGYVGTFLYGLIERLLLPFGLHHGLNWPVRTTELGGVWTIAGERVAGTINAYIATIETPTQFIDPMITRFSSGKFVFNMFGLPGAAYAMYKTAKPENRKIAGSLLFSAAATAFLTGITEPIEFTFLFIAPALYAVHAVLSGVTMLITTALGAAVLTPTGHGLINFIVYGVLQGFRTKWYIVPLVGVFCFFMYYFVFKFMIEKFKFKTPGREDNGEVKLASKKEARDKYGLKTLKDEPVSMKKQKEKNGSLGLHEQAIGLIDAHGGPENIEAVDACITRLRIDVKDKTIVQSNLIQEQLQALGFVESGMQMQSIYGAHANVLKMEIQDILGVGE